MTYICSFGVIDCPSCMPRMRGSGSDCMMQEDSSVLTGERLCRDERTGRTIVERAYQNPDGTVRIERQEHDDRERGPLGRYRPSPYRRRPPPRRSWDEAQMELLEYIAPAEPEAVPDILAGLMPKIKIDTKPQTQFFMVKPAKKIYIDDILPSNKTTEISDEAEPATLLDDIIELHQRS